MKTAGKVCVVVLAMVVLAGVALANKAVKEEDPAMMVSPQTIVLAKVDTVTVHTNIPAGDVIAGTLALDGVEPLAVWADNCGHIAARFSVEALGLEPGEAVLTLTGELAAGPFEAEDDVSVK